MRSVSIKHPTLPVLALLASSACQTTLAPDPDPNECVGPPEVCTPTPPDPNDPGQPAMTVANPVQINDVLYNPGMGFADFHFSWGNIFNPPAYPAPDQYPPSTVAYFRWYWNDIEPTRGNIDFAKIDAVIASAANRSEGEQLAFRIMNMQRSPTRSLPDWLLQPPYSVPIQTVDGVEIPDYMNPTFLAEYGRLMTALGARYDGHPSIDHIDIGGIGCWGEWNFACVTNNPEFCAFYGFDPANCGPLLNAFKEVIDVTVDAFPNTPKVMLMGENGIKNEAMVYAMSRGAGWRGDCYGDWDLGGRLWSHMTTIYPNAIANATAAYPAFADAWKTAPLQLEICWTFPQWLTNRGYSVAQVEQTWQWALDNHASVINGKSTAIPAEYWPSLREFLKKLGYRFVVDQVTHLETVAPGQDLTVTTDWRNVGVAPPYHQYQLAFRLRDAADQIVLQTTSLADVREWIPGSHRTSQLMTLPSSLAPGVYSIDVAILTVDGQQPRVKLAIEGKLIDDWYPVSQVNVN